jgi:hypothetical protein
VEKVRWRVEQGEKLSRVLLRSYTILNFVISLGRAALGEIFMLKPKLVKIIFKNSVRTAKKTQYFTITKINWLTLFKEIIAVYSENHTKFIKIYSPTSS